MNLALWRKNVRESQWLFAGCAVGLFAFGWIRVWIVSLISMSRFATIIEQFRDFEKFSPVPFDMFLTWPGRVSLLFGEPLVWGLVACWAIARGSDAVSGELGRGTLEMLLAQPLGRLQVLFTQAAVTVIGVFLLCAALGAGLWAGIATTTTLIEPPPPSLAIAVPLWRTLEVPLSVGKQVPVPTPLSELVWPAQFWPGLLNLAGLGIFLAGITTCVSSADRYRWRTLGVVASLFVVSMILKALGMARPENDWLMNFSFLTAYEPQAFVLHGIKGNSWAWTLTSTAGRTLAGPALCNLVLFGLGTLGYGVAAWVFNRRDLPAPL